MEVAVADSWPVERLVWPARVLEDPAISPFLLSGDDLLAYGRLRYELFVERDGKAYPHADHVNRVLIEPVDQWSLNFGVVKDGKCLIGVRATRGTDASTDQQLAVLLAVYSQHDPRRISLNSRLSVSPAGRAYLPAIMRQVYRTSLLADFDYGLVAARAEVVPLFIRYGFETAPTTISDPVAGTLVPMCLSGRSREHLRTAKSPYLRAYLEYLANPKRDPVQ